MHLIVSKKQLSADVYEMTFEAPLIAQARRAGQFLILQIDTDWGERIPLTIADGDPSRGLSPLCFKPSEPQPIGWRPRSRGSI